MKTFSAVMGSLLVLAASASTVSQAALTPMDSATFVNQAEMDSALVLDPNGNTAGWSIIFGGGGSNGATLSGGRLDHATDFDAAPQPLSTFRYWQSNTFGTQVSAATGSTAEVNLQVLRSLDGTAGFDRAFQMVVGNGSHYVNVEIGLSNAYVNGLQIPTPDNNDGFHTFRVAQDSANGLYYLYRDGVAIANDLVGIAHSGVDTFYFGEAGGGFNGSSSIEYARFTTGGFAPIPEPATAGLLAGIAALAFGRRRPA